MNLGIIIGAAAGAGAAYLLSRPSASALPSLAAASDVMPFRKPLDLLGAPGLVGKLLIHVPIPGGPVAWTYDDVAAFLAGCDENKIPPDWLVTLMQQESQCQPKNENPTAVGLIQFTRETAKKLGTTREALQGMGVKEQLPFVWGYWHLVGYSPSWDLGNMYCAMASGGAYRGADPGKVLFPAGSAEAAGNPALKNSSGAVTVGSVRRAIQKQYDALAALPRLTWE